MATIYIELLDEGVECWRPVEAEHLGDGRYRIVDEPTDDERWAFGKGDIVRCRPQMLAGPGTILGTTVLAAYERN